MLQIAATILVVLMQLLPYCCKKLRQWSNKKIQGIFFNSILLVLDGIFSLVFIMSTINIKEGLEGHAVINSSFWISCLGLFICVFEMIALSIFFKVKGKQLSEEKYKKRCGYVYEELAYEARGLVVLQHPIVYQLRFVALVVAALFVEYTIIQVLIVNLTTIYVIVVLGIFEPYKDLRLNYSQIAAESVIIFILDLLLVTSSNIDSKAMTECGFGIIGILALSLILTQGSVMCTSGKQSVLGCKRRYVRY